MTNLNNIFFTIAWFYNMHRLLLVFSFTTLLAACNSYVDPARWIPSHKLTVYQGNVITQDMVKKLQPGMTKSQVRLIMGTPLLEDPFHPERWDYNYTVTRNSKLMEQKNVTVFFENDVFSKVEGEALPPETNRQPATSQPSSSETAETTPLAVEPVKAIEIGETDDAK